jgi:hypothetical protein
MGPASEQLLQKCTFKPRDSFESEVGCPLDHCSCGTHDSENKFHDCDFDGAFKRCDDCGDFHDETITCDQLAELRHADDEMGDASP